MIYVLPEVRVLGNVIPESEGFKIGVSKVIERSEPLPQEIRAVSVLPSLPFNGAESVNVVDVLKVSFCILPFARFSNMLLLVNVPALYGTLSESRLPPLGGKKQVEPPTAFNPSGNDGGEPDTPLINEAFSKLFPLRLIFPDIVTELNLTLFVERYSVTVGKISADSSQAALNAYTVL